MFKGFGHKKILAVSPISFLIIQWVTDNLDDTREL